MFECKCLHASEARRFTALRSSRVSGSTPDLSDSEPHVKELRLGLRVCRQHRLQDWRPQEQRVRHNLKEALR